MSRIELLIQETQNGPSPQEPGGIELALEGLWTYGLAVFLSVLALGASALCLFQAYRLHRLLSGSPRLPDTFGFDMYQGSALQAVDSLKASVNELSLKIAANLKTVMVEVGGMRQAHAELRERVEVFSRQNALLQRELDQYRDGFLFGHQADCISRLIRLSEDVSDYDQSELPETVRGQIKVILDLSRVQKIEEDQLIGARIKDELVSSLCEVVATVEAEDDEQDNRIAAVDRPGYRLIGADAEGGNSRVIRKAKVKVFTASCSGYDASEAEETNESE